MSAPVILGLLAELTHRCPLSCAYCSNPVALTRRDRELSTETWRDVFAQAAACGALHVHLSGGEPAARRDLPALVRHASAAGLYTNLITSGFSLTRERLAECAAAGLDHVQLSVQAARGSTADAVAGLGDTLAHKAEVARWVRSLALPLTVNAVLHRDNVAQVDALIALAESWGARRLELAHVQLMGWAWRNRAALVPTDDRVAEAAARVARARERTSLIIDHVGSDVHAGRPKACMGGWGSTFVVVAPDGRVLPCHGATELPLRFSAVPEVSLAEAWQSAPFERFRRGEGLAEPCASCDEHAIDSGGCRCQAFLATGDARATDPACDRSGAHEGLVALRRKRPRARAAPRRFSARRRAHAD